MGSIHYVGTELTDFLTDIVGYKCGVVISKDELSGLLTQIGYLQFASLDDESYLRLHSTSVEEIVFDLLRHFGRLEEDFTKFPAIALWHKVKRDDRLIKIYNQVHKMYHSWFRKEVKAAMQRPDKVLHPDALMSKVADKCGSDGLDMVLFLLRGMQAANEADPWGRTRQVEWRDQVHLVDLFKSENLEAHYGTFFDQRFIDYLNQNFNDIDKVHWRKFEQFTAEYLDREGYKVALGPGRGDDGVDVRAWLEDDDSLNPHIVVQCKRQKDDVPKVVIKALYADIIHESANSGLLVTTSRLSPGSENTRLARAYPIDVADRATLREWLRAMRQPGAGGLFFSN